MLKLRVVALACMSCRIQSPKGARAVDHGMRCMISEVRDPGIRLS